MTSIAIGLGWRKKQAEPAQPVVTPRDRVASTPVAAAYVETWESRALVGLTAFAFAFGLMEMYSASSFLAASDGQPGHFYALKQLTGGIAGAVLAIVLSRVDYRRWRMLAWPMLCVLTLMLVVVVMPGTEAIAPRLNGARRWLNLGISIQPSEFMKVALAVGLAMLLAERRDGEKPHDHRRPEHRTDAPGPSLLDDEEPDDDRNGDPHDVGDGQGPPVVRGEHVAGRPSVGGGMKRNGCAP